MRRKADVSALQAGESRSVMLNQEFQIVVAAALANLSVSMPQYLKIQASTAVENFPFFYSTVWSLTLPHGWNAVAMELWAVYQILRHVLLWSSGICWTYHHPRTMRWKKPQRFKLFYLGLMQPQFRVVFGRWVSIYLNSHQTLLTGSRIRFE